MRVGEGARERTWTYEYENGAVRSVTDPLLRTVTVDHDAALRPTRVARGGREVGMGFDALDRPTTITPPGRPAHGLSYTAGGAFETYSPPAGGDPAATTGLVLDEDQYADVATTGGGMIDFDRDPASGRLEAVTLARGRFEYSYDALGRVEAITGPDGARLETQWEGPLVVGMSTRGVVTADVTIEPDPVTLDPAIWTIAGTSIETIRDDDGVPVRVGDLVITRDPVNGLARTVALASIVSTHTYDELLEGTRRTFVRGAATLFDEQVLERDALGRALRVRETIAGTAHTYEYEYDDADRLSDVREDGVVVEHYEHHPNGPRTRFTRRGLSGTASSSVDDRLTAHGTEAFTYRGDGARETRMGPGGTTRYQIDEVGTLLGVTLTDGRRVTYDIDPVGRRAARRVDGVLERGWAYVDPRAPLAETDAAGVVRSIFVYRAGSLAPEYMIRGTERFRFVTDQRSSVRLVVNERTGAIAQRIDYDAFGRVLRDTSPGFQPFGFAGGLYDWDTGLVRFGARDYDPDTGTWLTRDPAGFEGGLDFYEYAQGDPINYVDPGGEFPILIPVLLPFVEAAVASVAIGFATRAYHAYAGGYDCIDTSNLGRQVFEDAMWGVATAGMGAFVDDIARGAASSARASAGGACRGGLCRRGGCFTAGTLVETEDGLRAIETIEAGDRVLALDERTGEQGYYLVSHTTIREGQPIIALELIGDDETELVEATGEHPFWVRDHGWVEARHLERGDEVLTSRGGWIRIGGGTWLEREQTVYNLDVEEADTYFVGEAGAWVHNNGCGLTSRQAAMLDELRSGRDISARSVDEARLLIEHSGLRPYSSVSHLPGKPAPRGTFRGDLLNTSDPAAAFVHPLGSAPMNHALNPHYNLYFWNGRKAAIILF